MLRGAVTGQQRAVLAALASGCTVCWAVKPVDAIMVAIGFDLEWVASSFRAFGGLWECSTSGVTQRLPGAQAGRDAGINWSQLRRSTPNAMFCCKFNLVLAQRGYLLT